MATLTGTDAHRERILKAALDLLSTQGRDAVTTRSVAEAAKVQPPVLYRLFGHKGGLLDAVAAYGFETYLGKKRPPEPSEDPVESLRMGWDLHVEFGLENPELYLLMYANPRSGFQIQAAQQAFERLREHMRGVAAAGWLRVSAERACALYHAAAVGVVITLLASTPEQREGSLSVVVRELALKGIAKKGSKKSPPTMAMMSNALQALVRQAGEGTQRFTNAERLLLLEWLERLTN